MIKAYLKREQTDLNLGCLAGAYRATPHSSTGLTPNLLMLGRQVRLPAELMFGSHTRSEGEITSYGEYVDWVKEHLQTAHAVARKHLETAARCQKESYDAKLSLNSYEPGDLVWYLSEARKEGVCPKLQHT